jgi:hypothetical protein
MSMCEQARGWRLLAAVGLVLALGQGPAPGQVPIATTAAPTMWYIRSQPFALPPLFAPVSQPRPVTLFAWEKHDPSEWDFNLGSLNEALGDHKEAYIRFRRLCLRYPAEKRFHEAAERVKYRFFAECDTCLWDTSCVGYCVRCRTLDDLRIMDITDWRLRVPTDDASQQDILLDSEQSRLLKEWWITPDPAATKPERGPGEGLNAGTPISF